eukprot:12366426-Alexandrium_andersonii.AAC.1
MTARRRCSRSTRRMAGSASRAGMRPRRARSLSGLLRLRVRPSRAQGHFPRCLLRAPRRALRLLRRLWLL